MAVRGARTATANQELRPYGNYMMWTLIAGGVIVLSLVGQMVHLSIVMAWEDEHTVGLGYYGLSPAERARFKAKLRRHARLLKPILAILGRTSRLTFDKASFAVDGLPGPRGTCDEESFRRGFAYAPRARDVFVVTQMKCGTTWMQHVVYEVLNRGDGDLVDSGTALYAVSPWLEARKSVRVEEAPVIGEGRPSRLIKTHLPITHCPLDPDARYIYVARHPVSCFASCLDFIVSNAGPLAPSLEQVEAWFTSEDMWWGPWPAHVRGWWEAAQSGERVLFVRFEDMKTDLGPVVARVADFLGVAELGEDEVARIRHKCGFEYMRDHKEAFEMHPPHVLAVDEPMFVKGTADRHRDVPAESRKRILAWCRSELADTPMPIETLYPA